MTEQLAFSLQEAADKTGLSLNFIRNKVRDGEIRASYAGSRPLIRKAELDRWLESLPSEKPEAVNR